MAKFKIGDKVIAKKDAPYGITTNGWKGVVTQSENVRGFMCVNGKGLIGDFGVSVKSKFFDLDTSCNQKIVITSDGKTTLARLYQNDSVVKTAEAKCSPEDEFDFERGALIAFARLTDCDCRLEDDELDWKAFKTGKIAVKVTEDNFKEFVSEAKEHECTFYDDEDFNPFEDIYHVMYCIICSDIKKNELYVVYENGNLKIQHKLCDLEEFVWA